MPTKKAKEAILLAVSLIVLILSVVRITSFVDRQYGPVRMPRASVDEPVTKIDEETFEVITLSRGEWQVGGTQSAQFKNPKTGKFNMVRMLICGNCGRDAPMRMPPRNAGPNWAPAEGYYRDYLCPHCGKRVTPAPSGHETPAAPDTSGENTP